MLHGRFNLGSLELRPEPGPQIVDFVLTGILDRMLQLHCVVKIHLLEPQLHLIFDRADVLNDRISHAVQNDKFCTKCNVSFAHTFFDLVNMCLHRVNRQLRAVLEVVQLLLRACIHFIHSLYHISHGMFDLACRRDVAAHIDRRERGRPINVLDLESLLLHMLHALDQRSGVFFQVFEQQLRRIDKFSKLVELLHHGHDSVTHFHATVLVESFHLSLECNDACVHSSVLFLQALHLAKCAVQFSAYLAHQSIDHHELGGAINLGVALLFFHCVNVDL